MATRALDVITILHALNVLDGELGTKGWNAKNQQQKRIFDWLTEHRNLLAKVTGLDAKASRFWEELNRFLTDHKFDPMVQPFDSDLGIGVVSILDKLVKWLNGPGAKIQIITEQGRRPGFELPPNGVNIFEVAGYSGSYLLELLIKSDDTLWLFVHSNTSLDGLDMVELSMDVMSQTRKKPMRNSFGGEYQAFVGAQVPMVDFDIKPDISWLLGADIIAKSGASYSIAQAYQQFKMRVDETGARVKVATAMMVMLGGIGEEPQVFIVDRPFYGWWTQKDIDLPMAAFFADWDSFHKPAGSLEDL